MNILIVDDNPLNLKLMRAQLESEGHGVVQAGDGLEALQLLDYQPMDAVISDIFMPRMDGYRLCQEIRKSERHQHLPTIIYSSTFTSPEDRQRALAVGADKFLSKPASMQVILATLETIYTKPQIEPAQKLPAETQVLREYNQRLVEKLAQKKIALEQSNRQLSATREQLAHLIEHSPAVLYSLKIDGERVIPQLVSGSMIRLLGYTSEETEPFDWWVTHLHPEDRERALADIRETIKVGAGEGEYRIRHKAGHCLWVLDKRRVVSDRNDQPREIVGVWTDITERKQAENRERRAQRLESIGTLACGVAHDLNNILMPIRLTTAMLRTECPAGSASLLDAIETSAKRGTDMVKRLLLFVRGGDGEHLWFAPQVVLAEAEKLVKLSFPLNIALEGQASQDLPPLLGDSTQILQVLLNLCVNARDAMPGGGTLILRAEIIELDAVAAHAMAGARPGTFVAFSVQDSGMGIRSELLERIYEPFFSTKSPGEGTGLGLSMVNGIVRSHGGFMQVASEPGRGSTFTAYLPTGAPGNAKATPARQEQLGGHEGQVVLVVDDDDAVRNCLRMMLTKLNFRVLTAADGAAALLQVAENEADLRVVITDLNMPNMDGLAFARVLREKLPGVGIIVVTGRMEVEEATEFKRMGAAQLDKPFAMDELREMLGKMLNV